nr:hypothetical protein GZ18H11_26 [uncultured archaeon GZfos18H11]
MMIRGPAQCSESYELIWIVNGWQLIKMEAVEGIVKIGDKEELKIGDLMKKEKRQNGC